MWIYLTEGAFSIVAHRDKPDHLLVRSRQPDAIRRAFPNEKMYFDPDADYPYRADIHRLDVADFITKRMMFMTYDNFKNTVSDDDYSDLLSIVWTQGYTWGQKFRQ